MKMNIAGVKQARLLKKRRMTNYRISKELSVEMTQIRRWLSYSLPEDKKKKLSTDESIDMVAVKE